VGQRTTATPPSFGLYAVREHAVLLVTCKAGEDNEGAPETDGHSNISARDHFFIQQFALYQTQSNRHCSTKPAKLLLPASAATNVLLTTPHGQADEAEPAQSPHQIFHWRVVRSRFRDIVPAEIHRRANIEIEINGLTGTPCPFQLGLACNKKGGVCSLRQYKQIGDGPVSGVGPVITTCPQRFLESNTIFRWVGETLLQPLTQLS